MNEVIVPIIKDPKDPNCQCHIGTHEEQCSYPCEFLNYEDDDD